MERSAARRGLTDLAIALVLIAGLMGILPHMREKALEEKCIANLRLIGEAVQMYEEDYEVIMPWSGGWESIGWT